MNLARESAAVVIPKHKRLKEKQVSELQRKPLLCLKRHSGELKENQRTGEGPARRTPGKAPVSRTHTAPESCDTDSLLQRGAKDP